ncbi:MAG: glycosyltransferase family 39 protein [bacterium]|nr:glycosyltransferase family 39 protein [bacterium]
MNPLTKKIFIVFCIAFAVRIVFMFGFKNEQSLLYRDSFTYLQVVQNLLNHHTYSMGYDVPPSPDNFRAPLYPFFLLPFIIGGFSLYSIAIVQNILMSCAAVLVFLIGRKIFEEWQAFTAALLFGLEPFGALISNQLVAESLFSVFFVVSLFGFALYIKNKESQYLYIASLMLALSALTRGFASMLVVLIPIAVFLAEARPLPWKKIVIALGIFGIVFAPWVVRNIVVLGTQESSQVGFNLYTYNANSFEVWLSKYFPDASPQPLKKIDASAVNVRYNTTGVPELKKAATDFILQNPGKYAFFHMLHTPLLFTNSAFNNMLYAIPSLGFVYEDEAALYEHIGNFEIGAVMRDIVSHPVLLLVIAANLFFILVAMLALINPYIHKKMGTLVTKPSLFFVISIVLVAILTSPINGARMRIPLNPILFLLAINSLYIILKKKICPVATTAIE